jgi:hypothetical protein
MKEEELRARVARAIAMLDTAQRQASGAEDAEEMVAMYERAARNAVAMLEGKTKL